MPNYSFEKYDSCPTTAAGIDIFCSNWFTPVSKMVSLPPFPYSYNNGGSSDYYNTCSTNPNIQIPQNSWGFQFPKNGLAYSGIVFSNEGSIINDFKEYIEIKLLKKLAFNKEYCIEFYVSISESFDYIQNSYYPIEIGALLTDTLVYRLSGVNTQQPQYIFNASSKSTITSNKRYDELDKSKW